MKSSFFNLRVLHSTSTNMNLINFTKLELKARCIKLQYVERVAIFNIISDGTVNDSELVPLKIVNLC